MGRKIQTDELNERVREWEKRNEEGKEREEQEDKDRTERLRTDYLRRTKRTKCEP